MTLPKRKTRPRMGVREPTAIRSPAHMQWVRSCFECVAAGHGNCSGKMEAHHIREGQAGGMGMKPGDDLVVPACAAHHSEGHTIGWKTFEAKYGQDLSAVAQKLWQISPHRRKAEEEIQ